jgi:hypothetical protein
MILYSACKVMLMVDQNLDQSNFRINSVSRPVTETAASLAAAAISPLGLLADLNGDWSGQGFNQIWRPFRGPSDHFLELNETVEDLQLILIDGDIPNRALLQGDVNLHGMTYLQKISDAHVKQSNGQLTGLHIEPGIWLNIPSSTAPDEPGTVARLANIPHGVSLVAQGTATQVQGRPEIPSVDITPFGIGTPTDTVPFPSESNIATPSDFRTQAKDIPNVTQAMVTNPNSFLVDSIKSQNIISHVEIKISTSPLKPPSEGGGISNIAFLQGSAQGVTNGANAQAAEMDATFWIETILDENGKPSLQLQYSQIVLLNFNGLSWPHVSVATLKPKNLDS